MTTYSKCLCGHPSCDRYILSTQGGVGFSLEDARLYCEAENMAEALRSTLEIAESWVRSELEGTSVFKEVWAELDPARAVLARIEGKEP